MVRVSSATLAGTRRGTALVLLVVCLIPLVACVALAIDVGMLTLAQTQLNDAADAAALAGAGPSTATRRPTTITPPSLPAAQQAIAGNTVLGKTIHELAAHA